ncbi:MAG: class I SAM-dependent methyltransferase [Candidatus Korobacteraceae bacterium]
MAEGSAKDALVMTNLQKTKETLRTACPEWLLDVWRPLRRRCWMLLHRSKSPQSVFSEIYEKKLWLSGESLSGFGSDLDETAVVRKALPVLLKQIGARTMIDAPCGDFHWMKEVKLELERYIGLDIVPSLISRNQQQYGDGIREFRAQSITQEPLPAVDVILCRDGLVHLPNSDITKAIRNFKKSGSTYLLTTTFTAPRKNRDVFTSEWRPLNFETPPWNFPKPLMVIDEKSTKSRGRYRDKVLALWRLSDLSV